MNKGRAAGRPKYPVALTVIAWPLKSPGEAGSRPWEWVSLVVLKGFVAVVPRDRASTDTGAGLEAAAVAQEEDLVRQEGAESW